MEKKKDLKKNVLQKEFSIKDFLGNKGEIILSAALILVLTLIFFYPLYFQSKTFESGDILTQYSYDNVKDVRLWDRYIFLGMPVSAPAGAYDFIGFLIVQFRKFYSDLFGGNKYIGYTLFAFLLAFGSYLLARQLGSSRIVSTFAAFGVTFSLGIIVLLFIGHINKFTTLACVPLIFYFLFKFNERIKLADILWLTLILKLMFSQWHIQIIFYAMFFAMIFYLFFLIKNLIANKNKILTTIKSGIVFLLASGFAFGMQYAQLGQMNEYSKYSTRGTKSILDLEASKENQKKSEEDFYAYATNWSFSPKEIITFFIPSYYGFGNSIYKGALSKNREARVNTYFGQMPFADIPFYMGLIVLLLALFALATRWREDNVQVLGIMSLIALLISFGKNFPILFDPMFFYFPYFDKFRAPSMILNMLQIFIPILAALGISKIIEIRNNGGSSYEKIALRVLFVFGFILILGLLLKDPIYRAYLSFFDSFGKEVEQIRVLREYIADMFWSDFVFALFFVALFTLSVYLFLAKKVGVDLFAILIFTLSVIDIWRIDFRALHYIDEKLVLRQFAEPDYVKFIKLQNEKEPFRIFNIKSDGSLGSFRQHVNFHVRFGIEDFYGYSGIKPRSYQDFIDVVTPANYSLWKMCNVKYAIVDREMAEHVNAMPLFGERFELAFVGAQSAVLRNLQFLPRAFFVDSVGKAAGMEFLNKLKNEEFEPSKVAFVSDSIDFKINPAYGAEAKIVEYSSEKIKIEAKANGNNFLVLSMTYYPIGWKCFIDGKETKVYRTNHGLNGIVVPDGKREIVFEYKSKTYEIGRIIALIGNVILFVSFAIVIIRRRKE